MLNKLSDFIAKEQLFEPAKDRALLAVSGGLDSVTMAHLFKFAGYKFGIAHCNFQLRSDDSDADATFVKQLADNMGVPFYTIAFDTKAIAQQAKQSIQLAARQLRYEWLEIVRARHGYDFIATAHHLNDSLETIIYNFTKGCGIRGLHGIPPKNGNIIRPLLFASRTEIEQFAEQKKLSYRTDASNASDKYDRNKIRHHVVPVLESINPAFTETGRQSIEQIREAEVIFRAAIENFRDKFTKKESGLIQLDLHKIRNEKAGRTILFELLRPYNFNGDQVAQVFKVQDTDSGRQFFSNSHRLLIDRGQLLVKAFHEDGQGEATLIEKGVERINTGHVDFMLKWDQSVPPVLAVQANTAILDQAKLSEPIRLRRWQPGDSFQPFGMQGRQQSLKDFFINQKLSVFEKERQWVLESGGKICWVAGHRIDERFKVGAGTKSCLVIEIRDGKK